MSESSVILGSDAEGSFFYVEGDSMKYYDLDCLVYYHPEETEYVQKNRFDLERKMIQCKEKLGVNAEY